MTSKEVRRTCRKDDPNWPWPCSCDGCSRAAAGAWRADMDRVLGGDITLEQAILSDGERDWYESEFVLGDLGPTLDESRRRRQQRAEERS